MQVNAFFFLPFDVSIKKCKCWWVWDVFHFNLSGCNHKVVTPLWIPFICTERSVPIPKAIVNSTRKLNQCSLSKYGRLINFTLTLSSIYFWFLIFLANVDIIHWFDHAWFISSTTVTKLISKLYIAHMHNAFSHGQCVSHIYKAISNMLSSIL